MTNYLIIGGSGYIGKHLCHSLLNDGHRVVIKTRNSQNTAKQLKKFGFTLSNSPLIIEGYEQLEKNDYPQIVISLAGAGIVDKRWTKARKTELIDSRVQPLTELNNWLEAQQHKTDRILVGSAIGYYGYGNHPEITFHERSAFTNDFVHQLCAHTEAQALELKKHTQHLICLRTGVVLSPDGGALKKMLLPAKFHLNGKIGSGKQWVSWIHLQDWIKACKHLMNNKEPKQFYNLTAPEPSRNENLSETIGESLGKPFQINLPSIILKILLGKASILLLGSQKVSPRNLMEEGFDFQFNSIERALEKNKH